MVGRKWWGNCIALKSWFIPPPHPPRGLQPFSGAFFSNRFSSARASSKGQALDFNPASRKAVMGLSF